MTNITIYSHFADCPEWRIERSEDGLSTDPYWKGEVESTNLEDIFRAFNRVDEADCERLERIGYTLPSLSAGDLVILSDNTIHFCASVGWQEVDLAWALKYTRMSPNEKFRAKYDWDGVR